MYLKEACVETIEDAIKAEQDGADQIELCANLAEDGLTPKPFLVEEVLVSVDIPVKIMVRPRPGNFVYTQQELADIAQTILFYNQLPLKGYVFGMIEPNSNKLDLEIISHMGKLAKGKEVTIHKAIDACDNPVKEVERLLEKEEVNCVLTSGGRETATKGVKMLQEMIVAAGDRLTIIPAGKITAENIENLHVQLNARVYHGKKIVG